jgi:REP element-mobilizing transposase RayT
MPVPKRQLPRPPYNPGVRKLVDGKRAWDSCARNEDKRKGFQGWHERGYLPHRDSPGLTQFITYRLADSFPAALRSEWSALLTIEDVRERRKELEAYLDRGRGKCSLRSGDVSSACENGLLHFHPRRYRIKAWCIMPNHLHVLVEIAAVSMSELVKNWKGFSSYQANQILDRCESEFWADDYWDTYMRDAEHEHRTIRYIENNPVEAGLVANAKLWPSSSARFRDEYGVLQLPPRVAK